MSMRFWPPRACAVGVALLAGLLLSPRRAPAQSCIGDCDGNGHVTVDEVILRIDIVLENAAPTACAVLGTSGGDQLRIDDLIATVYSAVNGCASAATATMTPTPSATGSDTPTPTETTTPTPTSTAIPPTPTPTSTPTLANGEISIADAVVRDALGVALRLGERVTLEGVVTVDAGVFANNKLKIFLQDGGAGIMVYDQTSASVPKFQSGDRLQVTGVIGQADPTGGGNPANGTVLIDITNGSAAVLSSGNPLPTPATATLSQLVTNGAAYTGTLVHVDSIRKVAGDFPQVGDLSTNVTVGDDSGATLILRFQRFTITPDLTAKLQAIGSGPFAATAIVVQEDLDNNGSLLDGFQLWVRGTDDIEAP